jgi:hypothetical protein
MVVVERVGSISFLSSLLIRSIEGRTFTASAFDGRSRFFEGM